jgi:uncharacterized protein (DUF433 family)
MTPGYCGGRPRLEGTRLSVEFIVKQIEAGDTPTDIVELYPDGYITLAAVHSALSYYHDHKAEIDTQIREHSLEAAIERGEIAVDEQGKVTFLKSPPAG